MKKVFYWSPHLSNVATIKNVVNSAYSLKKYSSNLQVSIIDAIGEWAKLKNVFKEKKFQYMVVAFSQETGYMFQILLKH